MILDRFRLDGKVAVVTGAGRGVGAGAASALAEVGAAVVCAARTRSEIDRTAAGIEDAGGRASAVPCDVTERDQLEALIATTIEEHGRLDVLVNNAGGWEPKEALRTSQRSMEEAFKFNVSTAFVLSRLAVPRMVDTAGGGSIVNISSAAGRIVQPGFVAYGTAKAALSFMTRQLAADWAPKVRVNAVELGAIDTSALEVVVSDANLRAEFERRTPLGRIGTVEDAAAAVVYLASDAADYVTGAILQVDGGIEHPQFDFPVPEL